jgi:DNA-binding response OmpR family regulator
MTSISIPKLSVLCLDDHTIIRDILRSHLIHMGFHDIDLCATAEEADKLMTGKHYDIVLVDWVLPGRSGYALLQKYRAKREYTDVAFVMVTSQDEVSQVVDAMQAGATTYVIKPIIAKDFYDIMRTTLEWLSVMREKSRRG